MNNFIGFKCRISRFLVNDILRRDNAVPAPYILPISATITHTPSARAGYDQALDRFSRPLMARYKSDYRFGNEQLLADGIRSSRTSLQPDFPAGSPQVAGVPGRGCRGVASQPVRSNWLFVNFFKKNDAASHLTPLARIVLNPVLT
ncbi:hypothetical protein RGU77_11975 [Actimicrobium sp. CCI2.3]|nr:hypothetical protein [Actimicrobium sp. CCI2.3]MDY7574993.1 hypothetical protein [Actimicrobium sp. CCI2.3]